MFTLTMWVMLQTLDDNIPTYRDRVASPGLVIRPRSLDIVFNRTDPKQYGQYVQHLENFLQQYNDTVQEKNELCMVGEYYEQDDQEEKKVCQFKRNLLRQCSGLSDTTFGYAEGKPCVLVKMNRIIGLKPRGDPYINCTAKVKQTNSFSFGCNNELCVCVLQFVFLCARTLRQVLYSIMCLLFCICVCALCRNAHVCFCLCFHTSVYI